VAQSVWWIASITGLAEGLTIHINNLRKRSEAFKASAPEIEQVPFANEVSATARDLQEDLRIRNDSSHIHLDRISQIDQNSYDSDIGDLELDKVEKIIKEDEEFVNNSKKQRNRFARKSDPLTRTRSGKVPVKPLPKKQKNRLQAIPKDTISAYLAGRKK